MKRSGTKEIFPKKKILNSSYILEKLSGNFKHWKIDEFPRLLEINLMVLNGSAKIRKIVFLYRNQNYWNEKLKFMRMFLKYDYFTLWHSPLFQKHFQWIYVQTNKEILRFINTINNKQNKFIQIRCWWWFILITMVFPNCHSKNYDVGNQNVMIYFGNNQYQKNYNFQISEI